MKMQRSFFIRRYGSLASALYDVRRPRRTSSCKIQLIIVGEASPLCP